MFFIFLRNRHVTNYKKLEENIQSVNLTSKCTSNPKWISENCALRCGLMVAEMRLMLFGQWCRWLVRSIVLCERCRPTPLSYLCTTKSVVWIRLIFFCFEALISQRMTYAALLASVPTDFVSISDTTILYMLLNSSLYIVVAIEVLFPTD